MLPVAGLCASFAGFWLELCAGSGALGSTPPDVVGDLSDCARIGAEVKQSENRQTEQTRTAGLETIRNFCKQKPRLHREQSHT